MTRVLLSSQQFKYDDRHDVLHVYLNPSALSVDEEEFPGVVIRRSVQDDQITGFVIMDFQKRDKKLLETLIPRFDFKDISH